MPARRLAIVVLLVSGCGGAGPAAPDARPIGPAPGHRPPSLSAAVAEGAPVGRLRCSARPRTPGVAHVELFARGLAMVVPAGAGVAPPRRREGAYVRGGRCSYPLHTREPTGLVALDPAVSPTLGDLFDLLGQPLSRRALAGFRAPVRAWLDGRPWRRDPRALPLGHHAQVVVAVGEEPVPVHATYAFP